MINTFNYENGGTPKAVDEEIVDLNEKLDGEGSIGDSLQAEVLDAMAEGVVVKEEDALIHRIDEDKERGEII